MYMYHHYRLKVSTFGDTMFFDILNESEVKEQREILSIG